MEHFVLFMKRLLATHRRRGVYDAQRTKNSLLEWEPNSPRMIRARHNSTLATMAVLKYHAPTDQDDRE